MNRIPRIAAAIFLIGFLLITPLSFAAGDIKPPKLFDDSSEMKVTLSGPWSTVKRNLKRDDLYPVQLEYTGRDRLF